MYILCSANISLPHTSGILSFPWISISSRDLCLGGEAKLRSVAVEDDILALEEDITEDREADTRVALDTTEAGGAAVRDGSIVDQGAGNNGVIAGDGHGEVGQRAGAIKSVATSRAITLGAGDLAIVCGDNAVIEEEKSGASV